MGEAICSQVKDTVSTLKVEGAEDVAQCLSTTGFNAQPHNNQNEAKHNYHKETTEEKKLNGEWLVVTKEDREER